MKLGDRFEVGDHVDLDGELEFEVELYGESGSEYIDKETAIKLINHLKKVFNLDDLPEATNSIPSSIANASLATLREKGFDCVNGGYNDISKEIHTAVMHSAKNVLKKGDS